MNYIDLLNYYLETNKNINAVDIEYDKSIKDVKFPSYITRIKLNANTSLSYIPSHITHLIIGGRCSMSFKNLKCPNLVYLELGNCYVLSLDHLINLKTLDFKHSFNYKDLTMPNSLINLVIYSYSEDILKNSPLGLKRLYIGNHSLVCRNSQFYNLPLSLEKIYIMRCNLRQNDCNEKLKEIESLFKLPFGCTIEFIDELPKYDAYPET